MQPRTAIVALATAGVVVLIGWWMLGRTTPPDLPPAEQSPEPETTSPISVEPNQRTEVTNSTTAIPSVATDTPSSPSSSLLYGFNAPVKTITQDIDLVHSLFSNFQTLYRVNPAGTHQEIVQQLQGGNARGIYYIPKDHPSVNERGELEDRWGTPFFFHQIASDRMDIRSAGPDGEMWTDDDVSLVPEDDLRWGP